MSIRERLERSRSGNRGRPFIERTDRESVYQGVRETVARIGMPGVDQAVLLRDFRALQQGRFHTREEAEDFFAGVERIIHDEATRRIQSALDTLPLEELNSIHRPFNVPGYSWGETPLLRRNTRTLLHSPFGETPIRGPIVQASSILPTQPVRTLSPLARFIQRNLNLPWSTGASYNGIHIPLSFRVLVGEEERPVTIRIDPTLRFRDIQGAFPGEPSLLRHRLLPILSTRHTPLAAWPQRDVSMGNVTMGSLETHRIPDDRPPYTDSYEGLSHLQEALLSHAYNNQRTIRVIITYETEHRVRIQFQSRGIINSFITLGASQLIEPLILSCIRPLPVGTRLEMTTPYPREIIGSPSSTPRP